MRVDDDYAWGGGDMHGLYTADGKKATIVEDFLLFCKMAVRNQVKKRDQNQTTDDCARVGGTHL